MDNPSLHTARREAQPQNCPVCDYTWDVLGLSEYGRWNPFNENDLICPDCGKDMNEEG
jgi:hypothetical protein